MHVSKFILCFGFAFKVFPESSEIHSNKLACSLSIWSGYYPVAPIAKYQNVTTMERCLNICNTIPECLAANYVRMDNKCYILNRYIKDPRDLILQKFRTSFQYLHVLNACKPSSNIQGQNFFCGLPAPGHYPTIGQSSGRQRVLGGSRAYPHSYPYIVLLETNLSGTIFQCEGALIPENGSSCGDKSDLVITAAHCTLAYRLDDSIINGNITVKLGKNKLLEVEGYQMTSKVSNVVRHPKYNHCNVTYDYAILKLANKIAFNDFIRPVCLPEKGAEPINPKTCITAGWGLTDNNTFSHGLLQLIQPILNDSVCEAFDVNYDSTSMLCAGNLDSTKNVCPGDSGSPLVCYENGKYIVYGMLSFLIGKSLQCNRFGDPAYYSRVSSVIDWIEEIREMLK